MTFTAGGLTTQCVRYNISGDNLFEPIEQFIVTLSVGGQFVGVSRGTANVIIVDDDCTSPFTICYALLHKPLPL